MITSTQNTLIKESRKLLMKKVRQKENKMLIEGKNLLDEAHHNGVLLKTFHMKPSEDYPEGELISDNVMKHLTDTKNPPNDVGIAKIPLGQTIGERVLFLEHVQDPGNVGTLIRSALAFGFDTIVFDESADPFSQKVLRSTQGAIFHLNIHFMDIETFKQKSPNHLLIGTHLSDDKPLQSTPKAPYALLVGNEGRGLSKKAVNLLDKNVYLSIRTIDSLNVAIAGSIIMHALDTNKHLFKQ